MPSWAATRRSGIRLQGETALNGAIAGRDGPAIHLLNISLALVALRRDTWTDGRGQRTFPASTHTAVASHLKWGSGSPPLPSLSSAPGTPLSSSLVVRGLRARKGARRGRTASVAVAAALRSTRHAHSPKCLSPKKTPPVAAMMMATPTSERRPWPGAVNALRGPCGPKETKYAGQGAEAGVSAVLCERRVRPCLCATTRGHFWSLALCVRRRRLRRCHCTTHRPFSRQC